MSVIDIIDSPDKMTQDEPGGSQIDENDRRFIAGAFFNSFHKPDRRPPWQWAENLVLPHSARKQKFSVEQTPFVKEPLELMVSDETIEGTVVAAVQGGKSTISEVFAANAIVNDPGPMMWNFQGDGDAKEAHDTRILPMLEKTPMLVKRIPKQRGKKRSMMILFDNMFLIIQGAQTRSNLQSKSIRYLINDEVFLWPQGNLDEARKRTTAFWNAKRLNLSTGGEMNDDCHTAFKAGDMREWSWTCWQCGCTQHFKLGERGKKGGLKWDDNQVTRSKDGEWIYDEVVKTVRYECENCELIVEDTRSNRRKMNASGKYVPLNANPEPGYRSWHWNAMAVEWIPWSIVVVEFLKATTAAKFGVLLPLKEFIQKRLAGFWEERGTEDKLTVPTSDYDMMTVWDQEYRRLMTVDVQKDHFWVVIRLWSQNGASRLFWAGRIETWDQLREWQLKNDVPDRQVLVDCAWGPGDGGPRTVFFNCCRFGWTALRGEDREYFPHVEAKMIRGAKIEKIKKSAVSRVEAGDPMLGTSTQTAGFDVRQMRTKVCPLFRWSNPLVKDILEQASRGRGAPFTIARDTPPEWHKHMVSEVRQVRHHPITGKPDVVWIKVGSRQTHMRDCEYMQIVGAIVGSMLGVPEHEEEKTPA